MTLLAMGLCLSACGGGSGGSSSRAGPPPQDAETVLAISIDFPLPRSALDGVDEITVTGQVWDSHDGSLDPGDISEVKVNGELAALDRATGRWWGTVGVDEGEISLTAVASRINGVESRQVISLSNTPVPDAFKLLDISPDGRTLYLFGDGALRVHQLSDDSVRRVANALLEAEPEDMWSATDLSVDPTGERAILVRQGESAGDVLSISMTSGATTQVGQLPYATRGRYSSLYWYPDAAVDHIQAWLAYTFRGDIGFDEADECALGLMNLVTGERRTVVHHESISGRPDNPRSELCPGAVALDIPANRAVVAAHYPSSSSESFPPRYDGIYSYDLSSAERSTLSDADRGSGPPLSAPRYLLPRADSDKLIAVEETALIEVDLPSGDREYLQADPVLPAHTTDIVLDETGNRLLAASEGRLVSSLDLATGRWQQLIVISRAVGSGPDISADTVIVPDGQRNHLLVLDRTKNRLLSIDLESLERKVIQEDLAPGGGRLVVNSAILDARGQSLYYYEHNSGRLIEYTLEQRETRVVTSLESGSGPEISSANGLSLDEVRGLLYISGAYRANGTVFNHGVLSVDIATGTRTLVSARGQGPDHAQAHLLQHLFDKDLDRLVVSTRGGAILSIDPESGNRTALVETPGDGVSLSIPGNMAWDDRAGHILIDAYRAPAGSGRAIFSVDLDSGAYDILPQPADNFAFDRKRGVLYISQILSRRVEPAGLVASERESADTVTLARPN